MRKLFFSMVFLFLLLAFSNSCKAELIEAKIPDTFLKVDPILIIENHIIDNFEIDLKTNEKISYGSLMQYDYISEEEETIEKVIFKPNANFSNTTEIYNQNGTKSYKIYSKPLFYQGVEGIYKIKTAWTTEETFKAETEKPVSYLKRFYNLILPTALADDFYSGTGDGSINAGNSVWNTAHSATTGALCASAQCYVGVENTAGNFYIYRNFTNFDTSTIGESSTINSVSYYLSIESIAQNYTDSYSYLTLIKSTQNDPTELVSSDFDNIDFTELIDSEQRESIGTSGYKAMTLNSTGINFINKSGYTKISVVIGDDFENHEYAGGLNKYTEPYLNTGFDDDEKPYLVIDFTAPETEPILPAYNLASSSTIISYMEFPMILIIFIIFFLSILVLGNKLLKFIEQLIYERY